MGLYAYLSPIHNIFSGQSDSINTSMIEPTEYTVSKELLTSACESLPEVEFKFALNTPTGDFFYDKWVIKDEFKNTVWEEILNSLPVDNKGEARLIKLGIERCYTMHADIDDRWHLSFNNNNSCLIDLENNKMYQPDLGVWHSMNAGILHSAVNFGDSARYQLVVRQLLPKCILLDPINVELQLRNPPANYRYVLDNYISPKLNTMCKDKKISKFKPFSDKHISLTIEKSSLLDLDNAIKATNIDIEVNYCDSVL